MQAEIENLFSDKLTTTRVVEVHYRTETYIGSYVLPDANGNPVTYYYFYDKYHIIIIFYM